MTQRIRIVVVDDSTFVRRALARMFEDSTFVEVVAMAADGHGALECVERLRPDVVTLDVRMPGLDGLQTLKLLMERCPTPVVMLSSLADGGGENALKALELGAVDFIDKSSAGGPMGISALKAELTAKICVAAKIDREQLVATKAKLPGSERAAAPAPKASPVPTAAPVRVQAVLIGCSTGGPSALHTVLGQLPGDFPCPILIVQHMPLGFTAPLADRLNRMSALTVKEAQEGEALVAGCAYIAPAGRHLKLRREGKTLRARLDSMPQASLHVPAVDVLFDSGAAVCGADCLAVVLTGMGNDGSLGAKAIKEKGGRVVAEAEETAKVYGMPKAVSEAVQVDRVVPLYEVAQTVLQMI